MPYVSIAPIARPESVSERLAALMPDRKTALDWCRAAVQLVRSVCVPQVVGIVAGGLVGLYGRQYVLPPETAPLGWLFLGITKLGAAAVPINLILLGAAPDPHPHPNPGTNHRDDRPHAPRRDASGDCHLPPSPAISVRPSYVHASDLMLLGATRSRARRLSEPATALTPTLALTPTPTPHPGAALSRTPHHQELPALTACGIVVARMILMPVGSLTLTLSLTLTFTLTFTLTVTLNPQP